MYTSHERGGPRRSSYDRTGAQADDNESTSAMAGRSDDKAPEPYRPAMSLYGRRGPSVPPCAAGGNVQTSFRDHSTTRSSILNLVDPSTPPSTSSSSSTHQQAQRHYQHTAPTAAVDNLKRVFIPNPTAPLSSSHSSYPSFSHDRLSESSEPRRERTHNNTLPPIRSPDPDFEAGRRASYASYDRPSSTHSSPYIPQNFGASGSTSAPGREDRSWAAASSSSRGQALPKEYEEQSRAIFERSAQFNPNMPRIVSSAEAGSAFWNVVSVRGSPKNNPAELPSLHPDTRADANAEAGESQWTPRDSLRRSRPHAPAYGETPAEHEYNVHGGKPMTFPLGFVGLHPEGWDGRHFHGEHPDHPNGPPPHLAPGPSVGPSQLPPESHQQPPPQPTSMPMQPHGRVPLPSVRYASQDSANDVEGRTSKRVRHASPEAVHQQASYARPSTSASTSRTPKIPQASPATSSRDTFGRTRNTSPPSRQPTASTSTSSRPRDRDPDADTASDAAGSPGAGDEDGEGGAKIDAAERRRRNTEAARRSRARKRDRATYLEDQKQLLEAKTTNLRLERDYWKRQATSIAEMHGVPPPPEPKEADLRKELGLGPDMAPLGGHDD